MKLSIEVIQFVFKVNWICIVGFDYEFRADSNCNLIGLADGNQ